MKRISTALVATIILASCGTRSTETASSTKSEYPSTYEIDSVCSTQDSIQVCRGVQGSGAIAIHVVYSGPLATAAKPMMFIKMLYQDGPRQGLFRMEKRFTNTASVEGMISNGCLVGELGGCAEGATDEMKDLLYWAGRIPLMANAIDLEVAITDNLGNWDSKGGANYRFHFDERRRPW